MKIKQYINFTKNTFHVILNLFRYNFKIIFAGNFWYFLLAAMIIFLLITAISLFDPTANPSEATGYWLLLVPGILLIFYPTAFGIQHDVDTRMIEILFGIPNYRYKVWLVRLFLIFIVIFAILTALAGLFSLILIETPILTMAFQVMFPILFMGSLAFMFSTLVRNGTGTAVVMIIIGLVFWIARVPLGASEWNIFLNPFAMPEDINEIIWAEVTFNNRIYLIIGTIISILYGLFNLQQREKFV